MPLSPTLKNWLSCHCPRSRSEKQILKHNIGNRSWNRLDCPNNLTTDTYSNYWWPNTWWNKYGFVSWYYFITLWFRGQSARVLVLQWLWGTDLLRPKGKWCAMESHFFVSQGSTAIYAIKVLHQGDQTTPNPQGRMTSIETWIHITICLLSLISAVPISQEAPVMNGCMRAT